MEKQHRISVSYYSQPERIPTLIEALNQQIVDQLKALAVIAGTTLLTRKAELVNYVHQQPRDCWSACGNSAITCNKPSFQKSFTAPTISATAVY